MISKGYLKNKIFIQIINMYNDHLINKFERYI